MLDLSIRLPLDAFDLDVERTASGPSVAVFGPSGAGKTSLLEIVAGLRRAEGRLSFAGEAWLDSERRLWIPPERRCLGYVPQEGLLFPHRSVRGNLLAGAGRGGEGATVELFSRVTDLLELGELLDRDVSTLSGGERQRVALGRALCSAPRLLLLDEPLASLDLPLRRRVLPFLARVRDELALPMLLVSHDPSEVQALADEVLVLDRGRVVAQGEPHQVLTDPEVFSLASQRDYETVFDATLVASEGDASRVRLGSGATAVHLLVPRIAAVEPGQRLLVGVAASEALLATQRPQGVSAQNVLAGRVLGLQPTGGVHGLLLATIEIAPDVPPLAVELTGRAAADLEIGPGRGVYVLLKTAGCTVYGDLTPPVPPARGRRTR